MDSITNYEDLANAIILEAVDNYRMVVKCLRLNPSNRELIAEREEIEDFFRSPWFSSLTNVNGKKLIIVLNMEVKCR